MTQTHKQITQTLEESIKNERTENKLYKIKS